MFNTNQFILARLVRQENGDTTKVPCNARGYNIDPHNPKNWMSYAAAKATADLMGYRVGFVLTENDPYFCIDVDDARTPNNDDWSALAYELTHMFNGAYIETSQSGMGLHIFGTYTDIPAHACKNIKEKLELYHKDRFIMLGGGAYGNSDFDCTDKLKTFIVTYMAKTEESQPQSWTSVPVPEWGGYEDDKELIENAMTHRALGSVFNDSHVSFTDLWNNNAEQLAKAWPSSTDEYDRSSADMSLAQRLAYYTGKNCQRIYDLMMQSGLVRDKWRDRADYLTRTILRACANQTRVFTSAKPTSKGGMERKMAGGFVGADEIPAVFEGCVYILNGRRVFTKERGIITPEVFKDAYGGYKFAIDDGKTTRNAWEAFTQCPTWRFPEVTQETFRPDLEPLCIIESGYETYLNTYRPVMVGSTPGDVSRFEKLLLANWPDEHDRNILINYLAAVVQYPGRKFQWAPLLQGPEGNGKTFILNAMEAAIGDSYTHTVNAQDLAGNGGKFNAWMFGKLLITVEEIRVGNKFEIMEILKPLITNLKIEVQAKGRDQIKADNFANFIFTSNYMDALQLNDDQRRFCPLMSKPQTKEDIEGVGLTRDFFSDLWDWARATGAYRGKTPGFHHITHYLKTYDIQESYNPATSCVRAPRSTHYKLFASYSMGRVEQEIMESVDSGRPGFRGGFISSTALDLLLKELRVASRITHARRKDLLEHLGYVQHPALADGRVNTVVMPDGNRPKLYVKRGSVLINLTTPKEVTAHYVEAQRANDSQPQGVVVSMPRT